LAQGPLVAQEQPVSHWDCQLPLRITQMAMAVRAVAWVLALAVADIVRALHFDVEGAKNYPVSKVVTLLKDMQAQIQKEQDGDEEVYGKLACWCETNDKEKTKAVSDAEARIATLDSTIEQMTALSATLNGEIEGLKKELASNIKSLDVATALREKQKAGFVGEEKELVQSISALKSAVVVLSKHHDNPAAFLNNKVLLNAFASAKALMEKHAALLQGVITPSQKKTIMSLAEKQPTSKAYTPQSGQIFGILNQMRETFEADLTNSQKEEIASEAAFQDLKKAKEEQISTAQAAKDQKDQQLANTDEKVAQAKEGKEDTLAALDADQKFLIELKKKCSMTDKEWEDRQKLRHQELEAVSKAIAILSSDDAKDMFSKTFNPTFLQISSASEDRRAAAARVLVTNGSPKLAVLATSVRLDPFPKVTKAIDNMIASLLKEKEDEIKHKDYCLDEFQKNELSVQKKEHTKTDLVAKAAGLKQTIKEAERSIERLDLETADLKTQAQRAKEDREAEKKEMEGVVADQRETQNLLKQALDVLKDAYGAGVVFAQGKQTPPAEFSTYKKSTASTGVIMLLDQIIADAKEMEAKAMHEEQTAVDEYATFVKTSNASLQAKDDAKVTLTSQKAKAKKDLTQAESELDGTLTELESLSNSAGALHKSCDYTLKNFDVRQEARDQEVDALRQAKAYLSGMKN